MVAADVIEMRGAIAAEKGDADRWDLKYAAGGLVDIEFIAQYLQLVHAAAHARNSRYIDGACARQGVRGSDCCAPKMPRRCGAAVRLYHDLTQILAPLRLRRVRSANGRARVCSRCWRAPPTCRISPRSRLISWKRRREVRALFCAHPGQGALTPQADQRPCRCGRHGFRRALRSAVRAAAAPRRVVPLPTLERMRIAPPCSSTSDFAIARPRPEP